MKKKAFINSKKIKNVFLMALILIIGLFVHLIKAIKKLFTGKKKADIILVSVILVIALSAFLIYHFSKEDIDPNEACVIVSVDGEEIARYPLNEDGVYVLNGGTNTIKIEDGKVYMLEATCPDKTSKEGCVSQGVISKNRETIVCLPNKLIVEISNASAGEGDVDI